MKRPNVLSGLRLDRAARLRADDGGIERVWKKPETRVLPVWRSQHFVIGKEPSDVLFVETERVERHVSDRILLGASSDVAFFAVDLSHLDDPAAALALDGVHSLVGLREAASFLPHSEGALLAYANSMMTWHRRHRYCGVCGAETRAKNGGHVRKCTNAACAELHFPRTDPAVITLVAHADGERCLLGRQSAWPAGIYSTIAGFVEPGESLEEAVAREVLEETGIVVDAIHYHSAQPWPFPSSIMLGFFARATTFDIVRHDRELEDARWFSRDDLLNERGVKLPSKISIARRLVEDWLAGVTD